MNVVIRNLPDDTSEEQIAEILKEHGVPVTSIKLVREGNAEAPAAVVTLDTDHAGATVLAGMVDGKFWNGRTLHARAMTLFTGEDN